MIYLNYNIEPLAVIGNYLKSKLGNYIETVKGLTDPQISVNNWFIFKSYVWIFIIYLFLMELKTYRNFLVQLGVLIPYNCHFNVYFARSHSFYFSDLKCQLNKMNQPSLKAISQTYIIYSINLRETKF